MGQMLRDMLSKSPDAAKENLPALPSYPRLSEITGSGAGHGWEVPSGQFVPLA